MGTNALRLAATSAGFVTSLATLLALGAAGCRSRTEAQMPTAPASRSEAPEGTAGDQLRSEIQVLDQRITTAWNELKKDTSAGARRLSAESKTRYRATLTDLRRDRDALKTRLDTGADKAGTSLSEGVRTAFAEAGHELDALGKELDAALR